LFILLHLPKGCLEDSAVAKNSDLMRLAFIVSHPIQYYVPIYRDLAKRIRQVDETKRPRDEKLRRPKGEETKRRRRHKAR